MYSDCLYKRLTCWIQQCTDFSFRMVVLQILKKNDLSSAVQYILRDLFNLFFFRSTECVLLYIYMWLHLNKVLQKFSTAWLNLHEEMFCFNVYVVRYIFVNMCVLIKKINVLANSLIVSYAHQILHNTEQENDYSLNEHAIIRRRTDNGMTTIIKTTRQTMIHKILHRKLKIGQHVLH
jgi:hypothetical protein